MGFFGVIVAARTAERVTDVAAVRALGGEPDWNAEGIGGWRLGRLYGSDCPEADEPVQAIAEEIGGPVLCAYVHDSDVALVWLAAPGSQLVQFCLHEAVATAHGLEVDLHQQASAPDAIMAWAGTGADRDAVTSAVRGCLVFAEDSVIRLAAAVGAIPLSDLEDWVFGSLQEFVES